MSYFDDQEEVWFEHGCRGEISDVEPYDLDWKPKPGAKTAALVPLQKLTKSQTRRRQRRRAEAARREAGKVGSDG